MDILLEVGRDIGFVPLGAKGASLRPDIVCGAHAAGFSMDRVALR